MFCDLTKEDTGKACSMHGREKKFISRNLKSTGNCGISGKIALYGSSVWKCWTDSNSSWVGRV